MKTLVQLIIAISLILPNAAIASDPSFRIENVLDDSGKVRQTLVFLSEAECQKKMPKKIKPLMKLPEIKHQIINPLAMFEFPESGLVQIFYPTVMDTFAIIDAKNFEIIPYLLTTDLCECVGVGIYVSGLKAGVMHVGFDSVKHKFGEFLQHFPKSVRAKATVTLMSSYYTVLLQEVCEKLDKNGFKNIFADVVPIYLDCENRTSSGTKYYSYERLGFTKEDASKIALMIPSAVQKEVESHAGLYLTMTESKRALIMDIRSGVSCQFFPLGCGEANSEMVHVLYKLRHMLEQMNPRIHQELMAKAVSMNMDHVHSVVARKTEEAKKVMALRIADQKIADDKDGAL